MPIVSTDIVLRYSAPGALAGGSVAGAGNGASLGKFCGTGAIPDNTLDNLFPDLTGDENAASNVDYQCLFVHNTHATLTLLAPFLWFLSTGLTNTTKALALDPAGVTAYTSGTAQAAVIANKNTAPTGVTGWTAPTSKATGIALPNLAPSQVLAVWVRRTATNSAAANNDSCQIRVEGDTQA